MNLARWANWGLEATATWGLTPVLLLPLCSILKTFSAFLFICKQNFLIAQKPLVALQYMLQIVCRLMNEHTTCYHFTEFRDMYVYAESLFQSCIISKWVWSMAHRIPEHQEAKKVSISEKKLVLYVFMHLGERLPGGERGQDRHQIKTPPNNLKTKCLYCPFRFFPPNCTGYVPSHTRTV